MSFIERRNEVLVHGVILARRGHFATLLLDVLGERLLRRFGDTVLYRSWAQVFVDGAGAFVLARRRSGGGLFDDLGRPLLGLVLFKRNGHLPFRPTRLQRIERHMVVLEEVGHAFRRTLNIVCETALRRVVSIAAVDTRFPADFVLCHARQFLASLDDLVEVTRRFALRNVVAGRIGEFWAVFEHVDLGLVFARTGVDFVHLEVVLDEATWLRVLGEGKRHAPLHSTVVDELPLRESVDVVLALMLAPADDVTHGDLCGSIVGTLREHWPSRCLGGIELRQDQTRHPVALHRVTHTIVASGRGQVHYPLRRGDVDRHVDDVGLASRCHILAAGRKDALSLADGRLHVRVVFAVRAQ